jgi:hypothetical protein
MKLVLTRRSDIFYHAQISVGCHWARIRNKQLHRSNEQKGLEVLLEK